MKMVKMPPIIQDRIAEPPAYWAVYNGPKSQPEPIIPPRDK
jgi:hypothetical protein